MKIAIAGTGYVGLSNAILLSQHHKVTAVDVIQEKVDMVNRKESPIVDDYIEDYLAHKDLDLTATMDGDSAYRDADLIVIHGGGEVEIPKGKEALRPEAEKFAALEQEGAVRENIPVLITGCSEAESIKLFSNTFLAIRVAYFNEIDTYAEEKGLKTADIIKGMGYDPRIGDFYNNPSFGYGGYCLPKDTRQLLSNFEGIPETMIRAVVDSNETRKSFIADRIAARNPKKAGIYRLIMKSGSDNFRSSAIQGVIERLKNKDIPLLIYEPSYKGDSFMGIPVTKDLQQLKDECDIILTNREEKDLEDVKEKVYTRDLFTRD